MNYRKAFIFLISVAVTFAVLGGLAGYFIGTKFPGYYRSVFSNGMELTFDPVAVGVGQGLGQGFVGGVIAALIVIFMIIKGQSKKEAVSAEE